MGDKLKIFKPIFIMFFILWFFQEFLKRIFSYIFYSSYTSEILKNNFFKISFYSSLTILILVIYIYLKKYYEKSNKISFENVLKSLYFYFLSYIIILLIINVYINLAEFIPFINNSYNKFMSVMDPKVGQTLETKVYMFMFVVILAPMLEELIFRGILYNEIKKYYSDKHTVFITAVLFSIAHLNIIQSTYTFVLGICLGYIIYKYKNIKLTIFIHFINNISSFVKIGNIGVQQIYIIISIMATIIYIFDKIYKKRNK